MFVLSGFADEISQDLDAQIETLSKLNIRYMELRGVWGKNVLELTDEEVKTAKNRLVEAGIRVSAVGSPIGKIGIDDDFAPHVDRLRRGIQIAKALDTRNIRIFSYFIPEGENADNYRDEVMFRMKTKVEIAEKEDVLLLHENEKDIYGEQPERCADIHQTIKSDHLKAIFDPANFVQAGRLPYEECWPVLREFVHYFHIKDAVQESGRVVPAGEGNGGIARILKDAAGAGFDGFLSLEPHLKAGGTFSGFSGPDLFETAANALRNIMKDNGLDEG